MDRIEKNRFFIQGILDAISDPIFVKDEAHRWIYGNTAFSSLLGLSPDKYLGKSDYDLFPKEMAEHFWKKDDHVLLGGVADESEETIQRPDGTIMTALTKKVPFRDAEGKLILVGVIRDITARKNLEKALEESRSMQIHSSRMAALGEMSGSIAHEINNPLAVILGLSSRILEKYSQGDAIETDQLLAHIKKIEENSSRIVKIVKGLRSFSRQGDSDLTELVSMAALVEDSLGLCSERFRARGIKLILNPIDPTFRVIGNSTQLAQILINLLNNAYDSVESLENPEVHLEVTGKSSVIEIRVWDSGPGVTEAIERRIMEPFFTTKPIGKGTGLGLSISLGIAKKHEGNLVLDRARCSSCFLLSLPLHQ